MSNKFDVDGFPTYEYIIDGEIHTIFINPPKIAKHQEIIDYFIDINCHIKINSDTYVVGVLEGNELVYKVNLKND